MSGLECEDEGDKNEEYAVGKEDGGVVGKGVVSLAYRVLLRWRATTISGQSGIS